MSSKKLERQLNLIAALMEGPRALRAEEIHRRVEGYPESGEAFHRAFERDKDDLRAMGLPILMEDLPGADPPVVGYRITDADYGMDDPELNTDELAALHLATSIVRLRGLDDDSGLWKLGGVAGGAGSPVSLSAEVPTPAALLPLFSAVSGRATAGFVYRDAERLVDPERLEYRRSLVPGGVRPPRVSAGRFEWTVWETGSSWVHRVRRPPRADRWARYRPTVDL